MLGSNLRGLLSAIFGLALGMTLAGGPALAEISPSPAKSTAAEATATARQCVEPPSPSLSDFDMLQAGSRPGGVEQAGYGCPVGYGLCSGRCYPLGTVCCGNGTACPSLSNCCGTGCCAHGTVCVMVNGGYGCRRQF